MVINFFKQKSGQYEFSLQEASIIDVRVCSFSCGNITLTDFLIIP